MAGVRILVMLWSVAALGQFNKTDKILFGGLTVLNAADAGLTIHNITLGGQIEANPIARPFVVHGPTLAVSYAAGTTVLDYYMVRTLKHRGHTKLARVYLIGAIAVEAACVRIGIKNTGELR